MGLRCDVAAFYDYGNCTTGLGTMTSSGLAFTSITRVWYQGIAGNWCWSTTVPFASDINGDGKAEVSALYR
jgi:hypothetical protein